MNPALKILCISVPLAGLLLTVFAMYSHHLIVTQYDQLEREQVQKAVLRARDGFRDEQDRIASLCSDWANWDDLYHFCEGKNPEFPQENILPKTLEILGINYLMVLNSSRETVSEMAVSLPGARQTAIPAAFKISFREAGYYDSVLEGKSLRGFLNTGQSIIAFTAERVRKSDGSGNNAGVIVFGSLLRENIFPRLHNRLGEGYAVRTFPEQSSYSEQEMPVTLASKGVIALTSVENDDISGRMLLGDINGQPSFVVEYRQSRVLHTTGKELWRRLVWLAAGILLLLPAAALPLLGGLICRRISNLSRQLQESLTADGTQGILEESGCRSSAALADGINALLGRLREQIRTAEQDRRRLRQIFHTAADALLLCDPASRSILDCNMTLERLLGLPRERIVGAPFESVLPAEEKYRYLLDHLARQAEHTTETEIRGEGGRVCPVLLRSMTLAEEGRPLLQISLHNLSDLQAAREREERIRGELAAAGRRQSDVVTTLAHEIRTPLSALLGFADLGAEAQSLRESGGWLQNIRRESVHLLELVNDLLDHARLEAGKVSIRAEKTDLRAFLREIGTAAQSLLHSKKSVRFFLNIADNVGRFYSFDALRLRQIMMDLLGNAIKFTARGSVTLRVETEIRDGGDWLTFCVIDTGIGIPESAQPRIFDTFAQAGDNIAREYGGTGLGTAIARKLAELMNGELTLRSAVGQGTEFILRLPCPQAGKHPAASEGQAGTGPAAEYVTNGSPALTGPAPVPDFPEEEEIPAGRPAPEPSALPASAAQEEAKEGPAPQGDTAETWPLQRTAPANILLVEDYALNRQVASAFIRHSGHNLFTSFHGRDAVEKCQSRTFDLILMDVQLPQMDGLEATRQIRAQGMNRATTIIGLTAYAEPKMIDACREAGMNDVMAKPFTKEDFYQMLDREVGGLRPARQEAEPGERLPRDYIVQHFFFGKRELAEKAMDLFLQDTQPLLAAIAKAVEEGDAAAAQQNAHQIKSGAGYLGLSALQDICQTIAEQARTGLTEGLDELLKEAMAEYQRLKKLRATP